MKTETKRQPFILEFIVGKKYFSTRAIKAEATKRKLKYSATTINQYLYNLRAQAKVFDAGRGWYSTLSKPFTQHTAPVEELATQLKGQFPFLQFSCWSTEQVQGYAHHLIVQFTRFVYTATDAMPSVAGFLKEINYHAHLNPLKGEIEKYFTPSAMTVVVRPSVSEEPVDGYYATAEKMLIDLFVEKDKLYLMDGAEYNRIFRNLALAHRISIAQLLRYADRRKVKTTFVKKVLEDSADAIRM